MTDTGQVPGEGLPENAGMVEQPGIPAPGAYTFLDPSGPLPEDDDMLLMPGTQGAWSEQAPGAVPAPPIAVPAPPVVPPQGGPEGTDPGVVPPQAAAPLGDPLTDPLPDPLTGPLPDGLVLADQLTAPVTPAHGVQVPGATPPQGVPLAPQPPLGTPAHGVPVAPQEPVATAHGYEPGILDTGAHEAAGRDSGSVDLGGVRVPPPATPSRRPLHMGPPVPETATGGVVRSLADRGPAAPVPAAPQVPAPAPEPLVATGPAPVPVRTPGPPTTGPEYFEIAQDQQTAPQGAEPWAAQPQEPLAPAEAPAETVVPQSGLFVPVEGSVPTAEQPAPTPTPAAGTPIPGPEAVTPETPAPDAVAPEAVAPEAAEAPAPEAIVPAPREGEPVAEAAPVAAPEAVAPEAVEPAEVPEPVAEQPAEAQEPVAEAVVAEAVQPAAPADVPAQPEPEAEPEPEAPAAESPAAEPAPEAPAAEAEAETETPAEAPVEAEVPAAEQPAEPVPAEEPAAAEETPAEEAVAAAPAEAVTPEAVTAEPAPAESASAEPVEAEPVAAEAVPAVAEPVAEPVAAETFADAAEAPAEAAVMAVAEEIPVVADDTPEDRDEPRPAAPGYDDAEREAVLRVMRERRDIRNGFRSDPIPHEVLLRVLEAAHTAPSVGHSQPWDFVVIRSAETRQTMHELAQRQREAYAKSLPKARAKQFKELKIEAILDTPVNIVVTADPTRGGRHTLGRYTQPQMAPYSSALAVENLWLAARAEGLGVGWVSFFDEREMVRELGLPEHLEVVAYLCVGYVDEFPDEPELMQAGWAKRRPLSWVVHEETYGRRALPGEEPHDLLQETVAAIRPLDAKALGEAWERQKRMTKPAGALGMLEIISAQLCGLSRVCPPPIPEPAAVAIFAGDHGVHAQGVTPWPQEVTGQMVANFLGGGAVCNAFANQVGAEVCVIDVGVAGELPATPGLLPRKVRAGSGDFTTGLAMTREETIAAIEVGIETARDLVAAGNKALLTGEMGIANTTASAALISVFTGVDPAEVTGRGTGINDETHARKVDVVRRALDLHKPDPQDPIGVLSQIGGLEHAALVGFILGAASLRTPVILDGVSTGAAALVARAIAPESLAACIAGHRSAEPGHVAALNKLGLRPLVDLDLRLGEGTGALLALPLVQSAARAMHEVATFDSAGVTEK
ncbi:nicotinate-nucleotide--dimethylbenzimidazole phosphoribosyltransferase [Streptomyces sp. NRRL F-5727]|uniref:nicotinate-nucleotide--dimethylbenzimidazole phosphoribosyltransferase n=1 Tax=Streptomyces sp. NRRL F-5727 TaxID=1463871 RepID=UPI0004CC8026|nr:nicotinate-nucleotide--dimethylbenzimidazole phosphoribosyltransferase [Streptomyces sp. NRRL F-5727]